MFRKILAILSFILFANSASAKMAAIAEMPAGLYQIDPTHASVTWKVKHMGLSNYTARFTSVDAILKLDPKDLTKSELVATIDPSSVRTDYPDVKKVDFDRELAFGKSWFNAKKFPQIKFESSRIEIISQNKGKIFGDLTFMGVKKPMVLDATFNGAYKKMPFMKFPAMGFSATGTIKRSLWGLSSYSMFLGDDVEILIEAEFNQK